MDCKGVPPRTAHRCLVKPSRTLQVLMNSCLKAQICSCISQFRTYFKWFNNRTPLIIYVISQIPNSVTSWLNWSPFSTSKEYTEPLLGLFLLQRFGVGSLFTGTRPFIVWDGNSLNFKLLKLRDWFDENIYFICHKEKNNMQCVNW